MLVLFGWKALTREFFFTRIVGDDAAWGWLRRRFRLSNRALLALHRAYFCYGATRIFAWTFIARFRSGDRAPNDLSWGGPSFVDKAPADWPGWGTFLLNTLRGAALFVIAVWLIWRFLGRRLWERAPEGPRQPVPT